MEEKKTAGTNAEWRGENRKWREYRALVNLREEMIETNGWKG